MNEQRLIEIETKLAYQEDTIQQLNDVVCSQQKQIEKLETICKHLIDRSKEFSEIAAKVNAESHEKPPHY
jgi:SlyX protein